MEEEKRRTFEEKVRRKNKAGYAGQDGAPSVINS